MADTITSEAGRPDPRDQLLAYRAARGWSQVRTAEETGVSPATIAHIERGFQKNPRRVTLMKFAQGFGVPLDEFLSDPPKGRGPSLPERITASRTGHSYLTHTLSETIAFGQAASTEAIRTRIRELVEESRVLHEADRKPTEYLPAEAMESPATLKAARNEIKDVRRGFVVRVMALAEIGGGKDLLAEAERIVAEHQELSAPV